MSQENKSQQEEIIFASESNDGNNRYQELLEVMGIRDEDLSSTPSSAPRNNVFANLIRMLVPSELGIARK